MVAAVTAIPPAAKAAAVPVAAGGPLQLAFTYSLTVVAAGAVPVTWIAVVLLGDPGAVAAGAGRDGVATRSTLRTRWLAWSAMTRLPVGSGIAPIGAFRWAAVAGPPSPPDPGALPMPATVEMMPPAVMRRTVWFPASVR